MGAKLYSVSWLVHCVCSLLASGLSCSIFFHSFASSRPCTAKAPVVQANYCRAFSIVSKVTSRLLWFWITTLCDWLKTLAPLLNQSEVIPVVTCSHPFSGAWRQLHYLLRGLIGLVVVCVCCDWPEQLLWFWFWFQGTRLKNRFMTSKCHDLCKKKASTHDTVLRWVT